MAMSLSEIGQCQAHSRGAAEKKVALEKLGRKEFPLKKAFEGIGPQGLENLNE